jgi:hypothetical protein
LLKLSCCGGTAMACANGLGKFGGKVISEMDRSALSRICMVQIRIYLGMLNRLNNGIITIIVTKKEKRINRIRVFVNRYKNWVIINKNNTLVKRCVRKFSLQAEFVVTPAPRPRSQAVNFPGMAILFR